jgi:hypothetical protein
VQHTKALRNIDADLFEDAASLPRVQKQLANAILFQLGRFADESYCYLLNTAKNGSEPRIGHYHHDYLEELDWKLSSKVVWRTLSASMLDVANQIAQDLP